MLTRKTPIETAEDDDSSTAGSEVRVKWFLFSVDIVNKSSWETGQEVVLGEGGLHFLWDVLRAYPELLKYTPALDLLQSLSGIYGPAGRTFTLYYNRIHLGTTKELVCGISLDFFGFELLK